MPKEWILNQANMQWGLTKKNKVGPVAELIRKCVLIIVYNTSIIKLTY